MFEFVETEKFTKRLNDMKRGYVPPDKEVPNKSKLPFKKGTKKWTLYKLVKRVKINSTTSKFHEKRLRNVAVRRVGGTVAMEFNKKLTRSDVDTLTTKTGQSYVLINCGDDMFRKVSVKSYLKLCDIRKFAIVCKCVVKDDGYNEDELYTDTRTADNINALLKIITEERIRCDCIYEVQIKQCSISLYDFKYQIMIMTKSGEFKYYSGLNDFCKKFGLSLV